MAIAVIGAFSVIEDVVAQKQRQTAAQKETYTRPKPTRPIKPTIPDANRYQDDKVFLEYADSLFRPENEYEEFQIVKGNVKFRQGAMWMFCDSAYFYPQKNSMDAFGHVEMRQGDTLFVYADKLYYDGASRHATLTKGPSRGNVTLKDTEASLTTDSLDYDLVTEIGWYTTGGRLEDKVNELTSGYGEYSPSTKLARFRQDVVLVNNKDGYRMLTEELDYNTGTHIATINQSTKIEGANDTIITTRGWYDTNTDHAELLSRSTILHRDSAENIITLEGDSIIYDKLTRTSRAYMFRDNSKLPKPMVLTDTARKVTLIGGYGEYNDGTGVAYSTQYPLLMEYSRPDTLFLRADTIQSSVERDSLKEFNVAKAIGRARFFNRDMQGIADTLIFRERDSILYMLRKPVVWNDNKQVYGNRINVHFNDSTPDWAELPLAGMMGEHIDEDFYNQLTGQYMKAYFADRTLKRLEVDGGVQTIFLPQEKDSTYNKLVRIESSYLELDMDSNKIKHIRYWPEPSGVVYPLFSVKNADRFIEGFRWLESLRPRREWYGAGYRWLDDLGDESEELEEYFMQPPIIKEPQKVPRQPDAEETADKDPLVMPDSKIAVPVEND
ncbi:MAG: LPS export ABC transporter periplasmic protein LptC [Candidatus Amulumruptor caecigallinarius]|nr:LPS export ABC transporter periplasmic protein LptC [Candidatus Amulumruptor caecigallinarius]